jgi:hypothetical protein
VGGYRRDVANRVLANDYGVQIHPIHADSDFEEWGFVRAQAGGKQATCLVSFEVGLAAYPPDTLKRICDDLGLGGEFEAIRRKIADLGGWVGRR